MQKDFIDYLLADPDLAALVAGRIYWLRRPQGDPYPSIVLTTVSDLDGYVHNGRDGLSSARIQIDQYAKTYGEALSIERTVNRLFALVNFTQGETRFSVFKNDRREGVETSGPDADRPFRISTELSLKHKET